MIRLITLLVLFQSSILIAFSAEKDDPVACVNPFIGTAKTLKKSNWEGHGRTYPGAVAPFGYIQLTPETRVNSGIGYDYSDGEVYFFSCMRHMSGYPHGSSGQLFIQPVENTDSFQLNKDHRPFSHNNEHAEPGYYKLEFNDNGTIVETTTAKRSGMFRFFYAHSVKPKIFIGDIGTVEFVENTIIKGSKRNTVLEFDKSWRKADKTDDGIILTFDKQKDNTMLLKLSSSSVSFQNARENLNAEIPGWDFDGLKGDTRRAWEDQLSKIEVKDSSQENKTKFYSALYHSLLIPWIVSDVNKEYKGKDDRIYKATGADQYGAFSPWDTFRSLHPLLCLIDPKRQNDMIVSMLETYKQTGQLQVQPMTGYHSIPIIVDSYFKGIINYDQSLAYEAMKGCIVNEPFFYEDMLAYIENGYIPASYPESVTRTVEYAYNDWVLSQYARNVMNELEDHSILFRRSFNYRNLFDPQQQFLVPRDVQGFVNSTGNFGFKEGDKWNYSFFTPHNPRDIINLMGGDEEFSILLDSAIRNDHILFDNEPNFHIPYLFNYSKSPSKAQEWITDIRDTYFSSTEGGLPGNDDLGSMSSWFVFNALGFYPVCPGVPEYNIGTPLFEEVTIHSGENKKFVIKGYDISSENKYIQTASLNGNNLDRSWISHSSIVSGGLLNFRMGKKPSDWASKSSSAAYSATKKEVKISIDSISAKSKNVVPHELIWLKFRLVNRGGSGVKTVRVSANGFVKARKNIFVEEGNSTFDSVSFRLYKPGFAEVSIKDTDEKIDLHVKKSNEVNIEYSQLSFATLIHNEAPQQISFSAKNIGGIIGNASFEILLNEDVFLLDTVTLIPGEVKNLEYNISGFQNGMNKVEVGALSENFKVYEQNSFATIVDLDLQSENEGKIWDQSGFSNHGIIKSVKPISINENGFDADVFIEIEQNSTFSALKNEITLMTWVKASNENQHMSSIITQGDHNVIQLINNRQIEFFIGGWGRGICLVDLSPTIMGEWHHLSGVCDGSTLKVYIDGELRGKAELNNTVPINGHSNWNLGRNEEFPNKRIFYGKMDCAKIYSTALSQDEIKSIIESEKIKFSKN